MSNAEDTWQLGWQEMTLDVPISWTLAKVEGGLETGYLRLDGEMMPRLELRWGPSPRKRTDLSALVDDYLRQVRRMARKQKLPFEYKEKTKSFPAKGREVRYFILKTDFPSHIIISRCKQCGRVVLARILHEAGENVDSVVRKVFGSLRDHVSKGEALWSVFDLNFRLSSAYRNTSSKFRVGHVQLEFARGKEGLGVERFNFADEVLRNSDLQNWASYALRKLLRPMKSLVTEWCFRGEQGLKIIGSPRLWRRIVAFSLKRERFLCLVWRCPESDRIYVVWQKARNVTEGELVDIAKTIQCHSGAK